MQGSAGAAETTAERGPRPVHRLLDAYNRAMDQVDRVLLVLACGLFVAGVAATGLGALGRQLPALLPDVAWSTELTIIPIVAAVLLVAPQGFRTNTHLAVTWLPLRLGDRGFAALTVLQQVLMIAFFFVVVRYGIDVVELNRSQTTPVLGIPLALVYGVTVVSGALLLLNAIVRLAEAALGRAPRPPEATDGEL